MLSMKLYFKEMSELLPYIKQYSHAFRMMYNYNGDLRDKNLWGKTIKQNPLMTLTMLDVMVGQVETKIKKDEAVYKQKQEFIIRYTEEMKEHKRNSKKYKKLDKKRNKLIGSLENKTVFGGRINLKKVSYNANMYKNTGDKQYLIAEEKYLEIYQDNRLIPFYFTGRANNNGNQFFDFNFKEHLITFKPNKNTHFHIAIHPNKRQRKILEKLQPLIDEKKIPITVQLHTNYIVLTYDNELLNGFAFNKLEYTREKKANKGKEDSYYKAMKRGWYIEQEGRQLENKIEDRFVAIDLNPEFIGLTIRNAEGRLFAKCYELKSLIKGTKGNNTTLIKYNLAHIYKDIFKHCNHYQIAYFVTEELELKHDETMNKVSNRKIKNLWNRTLQTNLIKKYTQNLGIQHLEINPAYSSYVGNMMNDCFDPIAASAELARRGMIFKKLLSEKWYPSTKEFGLDNVELKAQYVSTLGFSNIEDFKEYFRSLSVKEGYDFLASRKIRYRRRANPSIKFSLIDCLTFTG